MGAFISWHGVASVGGGIMSGFRPYDPNSGGGTAGVASVTGSTVDNTDPLNPVVEAISPAPTDAAYAAQGDQWVNTTTTATSNIYIWSDDTTATDPGLQGVKINNADESLATELYISETTLSGGSIQAIGNEIVIGDLIRIQQYGATGNFVTFKVSGAPTDNGGWWTVPVTSLENSGGFVAGVQVGLDYWATGKVFGYYTEAGRFSENSTQPGGALDVLTTVTLGSGGTDPDGILTVAPNGHVTINKTGPLMFKQTFQIAKKTNPGNVEVFFQAETSIDGGSTWQQVGSSVNRRLANQNTINVFFDVSPVLFAAGTILRSRWAQSSVGGDPLNPTVGVDDSDLLYTAPSAALIAAGVQAAPSALAVFYKLEGYDY